jgi:hypothetical protein
MARKYRGIPEYEGSVTQRITNIVPNPKQQGSKARIRFGLYRDRMTIADYIRECETVGESHIALFDITYDLNHRFIELAD